MLLVGGTFLPASAHAISIGEVAVTISGKDMESSLDQVNLLPTVVENNDGTFTYSCLLEIGDYIASLVELQLLTSLDFETYPLQ